MPLNHPPSLRGTVIALLLLGLAGGGHGYTRAELGWILEDNEPMLRPLQKRGARRTKVFRVYDRAL